MKIRNTHTNSRYFPYAGAGKRNGAHLEPGELSPEFPPQRISHPTLKRDLEKGIVRVVLNATDKLFINPHSLDQRMFELEDVDDSASVEEKTQQAVAHLAQLPADELKEVIASLTQFVDVPPPEEETPEEETPEEETPEEETPEEETPEEETPTEPEPNKAEKEQLERAAKLKSMATTVQPDKAATLAELETVEMPEHKAFSRYNRKQLMKYCLQNDIDVAPNLSASKLRKAITGR